MWCVLVLIFFSGTMHIDPLLLVARNGHDAGYEFLYEALYEVLDDELQKSHGSPFPGPLAQLVFILLPLLGSLFTCLAVYQVRQRGAPRPHPLPPTLALEATRGSPAALTRTFTRTFTLTR